MALFPICLFLLVYAWTTSATSNANSISLSSELTNFIPTCAQTCFISFIEANFPTSICSNTPTLDCLCSHNSTSGYTIGEGAVQCILSEDQIGFCEGADALEVVVIDAFTMCNGQDGALPNTHGTITATLVAETASSGIVIIAPQTSAHTTTVTTTTTTSSGSSGFSTITRSSSSSSISTSPSTNSTTVTSSATSTSSSSTALLTSTSSPSQVTPAKSTTPITTNEATPSLTGSQIAGISVGAVGGAAVVAGLLVLCACLRRRRRSRVRDSDMMPFQPEPIEPIESMTYNARGFLGPKEGNRGPGGSANGLAGRVTPPPRPPRLDTGSPNMFSRRSIRPDTIGVAISPETGNTTKEERRSSRLLPEKPVLTLQMPPKAAGRRLSQRPPVSGANRGVSLSRESTGTQFEEDIDSAVIVDDIPTRQELDDGGWRPQRPSDSNPTIPDFPMPGETRAFHGQPANTKSIVPDYYIKPLQLGRGRTPGSFSQPQVPERNPQRQLQQLNISGQVSRPITGSSSVYSGRPSLPPSEGGRSNPSYNPPPKNRNSYKQTGPYDSWESEPRSAGSEKEPKTAGTELSPVIESPKSPSPRSPSSPSGVSPVSYPKIPKLLSPATIRMVPPPPQPDFSQVFSSRGNTVRIVPPEKALLPVRRADTDLKPWRQAEIAAQQARIQNQQNQAKQQEQQSSYQAYQRPRPQPQPQQKDSLAPSARYNYNAPLSSQNQSQISNRPKTSSSDTLPTLKTPNQDQNFPAQRQPTALEAFNNKQNEKLRTQSTQSRNSSILTTTSIAASSLAPSTTSSLLAKRRGSKQAAALALNNKNNEEEARRNAAKWRVLQEKEIEAAKSPGWRPQLGQATLGSGGASGDGRFADTRNFDSEKEKLKKFERTELPNTPGWVPRLTPTRRGDELFLSVQ